MNQVQKTIYNQVHALKPGIKFTGIVWLDNGGVRFCKRSKNVDVVYNRGTDSYDVQVCKIAEDFSTKVTNHHDIYVEQLKNFF